MNKIKIGIIFGGNSFEYNVSLVSAYAVLANINHDKYEVMAIGINECGQWFRYLGNYDDILNDTWQSNEEDCYQLVFSLNPNNKGFFQIIDQQMYSLQLDLVFPVLHGKNGEDGTVQGMMELMGIKIVGCGCLSSALCMDKKRSHDLVEQIGINVANAITFYKEGYEYHTSDVNELKFPLFVKPLRAGSSFGITKVYDEDTLEDAIRYAFKYDDVVIVEETIEGIEIGCAVMGNNELVVGRVDEIEIHADFYDYQQKYSTGNAKIHMPARITEDLEKEICNVAKRIYQCLGCKGFARVDLFLTANNILVFNEVNTIPGLTSHSRYPKMMQGIGIEFPTLIECIIEISMV